MAYKSREEIVGKRFLSVRSPFKPKISRISEWDWRSGVVRAVSNRDQTSFDFTVLVEFDNVDWKKREWFHVHDIFQVFLVEHTLVWTYRPLREGQPPPLPCPGLCYKPLVDKCGLAASKKRVVEFLGERDLAFVQDDDLHFYQEGDEYRYPSVSDKEELRKEIRTWVDYQDGQKILLTTPVVLVGSRVEVYRAEGTTQWYTAFIHSINDATKTLTITDDTVLESHNEDPALVQMRIIDNTVVHSILRGDTAPRRTSRQLTAKDSQPQTTLVRRQGQQLPPQTSSGVGSSSKQGTVTSKTRQGHSLPPHSSAHNLLPFAHVVLTPTITTPKQVSGQEKVNSRSGSKSQVSEKRKRKLDTSSLQQSEEAGSASPNKRHKNTEDTDKETWPPETDSCSSIRQETTDCSSEQSVDISASSSLPPGISAATPIYVVSGSRDKTDSKSLRPKKGSNSSKSVLSVPCEVSRSSIVSLSSSSVGTTTVTFEGKPAVDSLLTSACHEKSEDSKENRDSGNTSSSSVIKTVASTSVDTNVPVRTNVPVSAIDQINTHSPETSRSSDKKEEQTRQVNRTVSQKVSSEGRGSKSSGPVRHGTGNHWVLELSVSAQDAAAGPSQTSAFGGGDLSHSSSGSSSSRSQQKPPPLDCGHREEEVDTMHFKKQLLLAGGNNSPSASTTHSPASSISASIDVNRSVTDQLTKLAKAEKIVLGGGDGKTESDHSADTAAIAGTFSSSVTTPVSQLKSERDCRVHDFMADRNKESSAFTSVRAGLLQSNITEERAESRASDGQVSSGVGDERRPGSRLDDLRSAKSSPTSSPLILDRNEPINIYRDPELMSKNPVRSGLSVTNIHKTMSGPGYPTAPGGVPAPPPGLTTSTTLASHPSSLSRFYSPHQLPSALSHSLPLTHAFSQLDALTAREMTAREMTREMTAREMAAVQQQQQQQQQQQIAALQQQYQNAAQLMHPMPYAGHRLSQLDLLWQQTKLPPGPLTPAWLLAKHPEGTFSDNAREHLERMEQDRIDRERLEKRLEMERIERDRQERVDRERREKREKMERERQEREKAEKEKVERERAEQRERQEKERKERERLIEQREWEHQRHQERERILRESAETSAQAAVDEHFVESFNRVAKLRSIAPWVKPSITKGTGKGLLKLETDKAAEDERIKREVDQQRALMSEDKRYMNSMLEQQQRGDTKPEVMTAKDGKPIFGYPPYHYGGGAYPPHPSSTNIPTSSSKSEAIFSLYGYPSQQHSTITTEQLQKKGLAPGGRPLKEEKPMYSGPPGNPSPPRGGGHMVGSVHPPKEMKMQNSVIVENKVKMEKLPTAAHSHHPSSLSSSSSSSPHPQPRPAHTPEQRPDRPLSSSTSLANPPLPHHLMGQAMGSGTTNFGAQSPHHPTAFRALDPKAMSRSQSPYKILGGQPTPVSSQPQSAGGQPEPINFSSKSKGGSGLSSSPYPTPAIAQPPVSLPASSLAFSYSLIQQGLVPNPMYSQGSLTPAMQMTRSQQASTTASGTSTPPSLPHNSHPPSGMAGMPPTSQTAKSQQSPPGSTRRKNNNGASRDNGSLPPKRAKLVAGPQADGSRTGSAVTVPVTTPQVLTNPSPYTTSSGNSMAGRMSGPSMSNSGGLPPSGFMDSFRSFVENTVQNAYLQDEKSSREKEERDSLQKHHQELKQQQQQQQQQQLQIQQQHHHQHQHHPHPPTQQQQIGSVVAEKMGGASVAGGSVNREEVAAPALSVVSSQPTVSSSSLASITDTINRVANGQDTDSDTLSAPSPPPQARTDNASPQSHRGSSGGSSAPKLKKAWLMRHADDEKPSSSPLVPSPLVFAQDDSNSSQQSTSKEVKQYLKSSSSVVVDPASSSVVVAKVNGDVSPAPVTTNSSASNTNGQSLPNGNISTDLQHQVTTYESTSSASETEMQTTASAKKRSKSKKSSSSAKKAKSEEKAPSPILPLQPTGAPNSARKKTSNKRTKNDKDNSKVREKPSPPETRSVSPSPSSTPRRSPAPTSSSNSASGGSSKKEEKPGSKHSSGKQSGENSRSSSPPASQASGSQDGEKSSSPESVSHSRDKKKTRRSKEAPKDTSSRNGKQGSSFNEPLLKCSLATLKRTGAPFLQNGPCSEVTPKLSKCRECKMTPNQRSKKIPNIFCRFYAFRRLKYSPKGAVTNAGFSELSDADPDDIEPWLPRYPIEEPALDEEMGKFILSKVGDKFCELVEQEKEAKSLSGMDPPIVWKRAVTGVREMCDVCDTTLFNMHWVCHKCGFVVCLDCYKAKIKAAEGEDEDDCKWLTCSSNRQAHDARKLMLTQIIPSDALWELGRLIHDIRRKWSIPAKCSCSQNSQDSKPTGKNGMNPQMVKKIINGIGGEEGAGSKKSRKAAAATAAAAALQQAEEERLEGEEFNQDKLSLLASVSVVLGGGGDKISKRSKLEKLAEEEFGEDGDKKSSCSTLRELLTKTAGKGKVPNEKKSKPKSSGSTLENIIQSVVEKSNQTFKFLHYIPRLGQWNRELPIIAHNLTETSVLYPDVPHSWLCDGRLLRLHDPRHKGNLKIFQEQWKRGQPVLVSCVHKLVNKDLWKPEAFNKEFGRQENDLVNCRNSNIIMGHLMSDFWEGFESIDNRLLDEDDDPMLVKLKDWPPGDDFSELLPAHFHDLMQALPLPEYTRRNGILNLASRLPDFLVRPDLGPKMYNAYGSARFPKEGTTNLHLDISDAVNVLVYVGVPSDRPAGHKEHEEAAVRAIDEAGCDSITKRRVREVHELPGALWQIYDAHDADKIRDFLNKVAKERGEIIEPDHDSIHDQSWYLDEELRERLLKEYGVQGYTIVQCMGDAIFIPAGAPHQVRNLHSCIKVAEDFVSPEHINHCFRLTQEFRQLSNTHSNHEDKLQVKNIIYHAVKDSIAVLRELDPDDKK